MLIFDKIYGNMYSCTSKNMVIDSNTFWSLAGSQNWVVNDDGNNVKDSETYVESLAAYLVCTKREAKELLQAGEYELVNGVWEPTAIDIYGGEYYE